MSNPTTPFGWQMPENTDLVTDLPADFEVFGQAVATSMADLLGGTTGQVLAKASNTDMDFVWSADAAGMTNPMTTTGDIIYSSPGSTPVRRAIGSTGNVLTVAGGIPTWAAPASGGAGNMVQIASGTMTSGSTLNITGLSSYTDILFVVDSFTFTASNQYARLTVNNNTTANYARYTSIISTGQNATDINVSASDSNFILTTYTDIATNNGSNYFALKFTNCKNPGFTDVDYNTNWRDANYRFLEFSKGIYKVSEAVSSLQFFTTGSTTFTGGNYYVWGA